MSSSAESSSWVTWLRKERVQVLRAAGAELVGTLLLVFFTCGTCVTSGGRGDALVATAFSFGLTLSALVVVIGPVSGCHVNPAVTLGLFLAGKLRLLLAIVYLLAQVLGAAAGAALLAVALGSADRLCVTALALRTTPAQGVLFEAVIVFLFVAVILGVGPSHAPTAPLLIGFALAIGHLLAIPETGSSMNPARSLGPALVSGQWDDHWVYWLGPLLGGGLAGLAHRFLIDDHHYKKCPQRPSKSADPADETTAI